MERDGNAKRGRNISDKTGHPLGKKGGAMGAVRMFKPENKLLAFRGISKNGTRRFIKRLSLGA
jgi:hypothetical protein